MKKSYKRVVIIILVIAVAFAAYSPSAYCVSPSPTTVNATPSQTPADSATASPADNASASPTESAETSPDESSTVFKTLQLNDKGLEIIRLQMRLRELGYFNLRATGNYFNGTKNAVTEFQQKNGLDSDGQVGQMSYAKLYSFSGVARRPKSPSVYITSGKTGAIKVTGQLGDWVSISAAFPVSTTAAVKVTDCITGDSFNVYRTGGVNLAEIEPATSGDNDIYKSCYNGKAIWEERAVVVTVNGADYAASLCGYPAGSDNVADNGMTGHTTLYFYGSTSDVLGFANKEDLKEVLIAAGKPVLY